MEKEQVNEVKGVKELVEQVHEREREEAVEKAPTTVFASPSRVHPFGG